MAKSKITKVLYGETIPVQVKQYEIHHPHIELSADVHEDEDWKDVYESLRHAVKERLDAERKAILKKYRK